MGPWLALAVLWAAACLGSIQAGVIIDRIAVVVNRHPIKASDIVRDLKLTAFLNQEPVKMDPATRRSAADRLVDQEIIRNALASGGYARATDADADHLMAQIRRDRFGNSAARMRQELMRYGLTEDQLHAQLLWQLTVLRFIDQRFRGGILVDDDDIRNYYTQHRAQYRGTLESETKAIRDTLEGEQVNQQFETWLDDARKRANVQYKDDAFQ
jgi:hypothetical protein